jgi:hypothetical protein
VKDEQQKISSAALFFATTHSDKQMLRFLMNLLLDTSMIFAPVIGYVD